MSDEQFATPDRALGMIVDMPELTAAEFEALGLTVKGGSRPRYR